MICSGVIYEAILSASIPHPPPPPPLHPHDPSDWGVKSVNVALSWLWWKNWMRNNSSSTDVCTLLRSWFLPFPVVKRKRLKLLPKYVTLSDRVLLLLSEEDKKVLKKRERKKKSAVVPTLSLFLCSTTVCVLPEGRHLYRKFALTFRLNHSWNFSFVFGCFYSVSERKYYICWSCKTECVTDNSTREIERKKKKSPVSQHRNIMKGFTFSHIRVT